MYQETRQTQSNEAVETAVSLADVDGNDKLPSEKKRGKRGRKLLLAGAALGGLLVTAGVGAYFLLGGHQVEVKAGQKAPEKVTSGRDLTQAATDMLNQALDDPSPASPPGAGAVNVGMGQSSPIGMAGVPRPQPGSSPSGNPSRLPASAQSGIAATLAPPPAYLLAKDATSAQSAGAAQTSSAGRLNQPAPAGQTTPTGQPAASGATAPSGIVVSRRASAQSVRFAAVPKAVEAVKPEVKASGSIDHGVRTGAGGEQLSVDELNTPALASRRVTTPKFGAMLPVRLMGVLYTLRPGNLARLELVRDIKAGNRQLKRGTVFVGAVVGSELDRAYVEVKGYIDPESQGFIRFQGDALGSDGGAGLRGKKRRVSSAWVKVLDRLAQTGTQIATSILGRRAQSVIISGDPEGTYRSASGRDQSQPLSNRTFVEVSAGSTGFILVTSLPETVRPDSHRAGAEPAAKEEITDRELAELLAEAEPERIRAALPRLPPELRRAAGMVLKEIEAGVNK
jgi:hypothetical protein